MTWLNYHHLMYFKTIAIEGSIAKASLKLLVGQPALSAQLKQFEEHLGAKLFDRRNRGLHLTEAGRLTLKYANEISHLGNELQSIVTNKSFIDKPSIKVGSLDSVPKSLITHFVQYITKQGVSKVRLIEGGVDELLRENMAGNIDLFLSNYPVLGDSSAVYSKSIGKSPVSIYCSKKFIKLKKGFPNSLTNAPVILPTAHSKMRHDIDHYLDVNGIHIDLVAETQDTSVQKSLGIHGMGLIPLADFSVKSMLDSKALFKLGDLKGVYEEYWLVSSKKEYSNPIINKIIDGYKITIK